MNKLQNIDYSKYGHIFVTLNPLWEPRKESIKADINYSHPIYTNKLIQQQKELKHLTLPTIAPSSDPGLPPLVTPASSINVSLYSDKHLRIVLNTPCKIQIKMLIPIKLLFEIPLLRP